jgi:hypothetical protein
MAFRIYIVPVIGTGAKTDPRSAKYFTPGSVGNIVNPANYPAGWQATFVDYGFEPWMFVGADLNATDDAAVIAKPDGFALPVNLDVNLTSANVTNVQNKLESINVPAGWVNTSLTWRTVARTVLGMFSFIQRYGTKYAEANGSVPPSIFTGGVSLSTTFGSLSVAVQSALTSTAQSFGISTAGLTAGTTLRVILKAMADFFSNAVFLFGGVSI